MIKLNPSRCVRYFSKFSECDRCESICPTEAVAVQSGAVSFYQDRCVECGGCVGVCPTEAIELSGFDPLEFVFSFLKEEKETISCKDNFLCLAGLNVEYLVALRVAKRVVLDVGHCAECDIAHRCLPQIESNVAEANYILEAMEQEGVEVAKLSLSQEEMPKRRDFFNIFTLKGAARIKGEFEEEIKSLEDPTIALDAAAAQAIRNKEIPNKRKFLFTILKKMDRPEAYRYLENEHLSFTSDKEIDDSCDNCSICYRICPTEALSSDQKQSKIYFDPLLCVRCHLCHDVCEKDSIKLSKYFDTKEFFEPKQKILAQFKVIRCEDCGAWFSYFGGERLCPRCAAEEDAARELWGLK